MADDPPGAHASAGKVRCHGYANGCRCAACRRREHIVATHVAAGREPYSSEGKLKPLPRKRKTADAQPWDPRPPRSGRHEVLDINTPAGAPPRDLLDATLRELVGQVTITASHAGRPPQLQPAVTAARIAQEMDDVDGLVKALRDIAHAAVASIVRVRAASDA